jgi:polysaccharide pyruvyl transferase WcaK-like protein
VRIAVFGSYNGTSVGDTAILLGLLRAIDMAAPGADVTVLSMGPIDLSRDLASIGRATAPRMVRANAWGFQEVPVLRSLLWRADRWVRYSRWLGPINAGRCRSILEQQDMLVIGGGNLLMDMFEGNVRIIETVCGAARAAGVPYSFLGIGAGPVDRADSRRRLAACLAGAQAVLVRDAASRDLCRDILARQDTRQSPDLAFALQGIVQPAPHRGTLALNVASMGDKTWPWQDEGKYSTYVEGFIRLARAAAQRLKPDRVDIVSTNITVDHRATHEVAAALGRGKNALDCPVSVIPCNGPTAALAAFSEADLAITTRLHAGILAAIAGCRILPVVYDGKVRGVLEEEGIASSSVDPGSFADSAWDPGRPVAAAAAAPGGVPPAIAAMVLGDVEKLLMQPC